MNKEISGALTLILIFIVMMLALSITIIGVMWMFKLLAPSLL